MLANGNYPEAISLLLECQEEASHYQQFTSVAALASKFQDSLVMAEEQLDVALGKVIDINTLLVADIVLYHFLSANQ